MTRETADRLGVAALLIAFLLAAIAIFASVPHQTSVMAEQIVPGADALRAPEAIRAYGCGACHMIPGVPGANGKVGPRLDNLADQSFIAGQVPNTPDNLVLWIMHPQKLRPGGDMPEMGVSAADARNIAAYLYSVH